jgi:hypothetical protein
VTISDLDYFAAQPYNNRLTGQQQGSYGEWSEVGDERSRYGGRVGTEGLSGQMRKAAESSPIEQILRQALRVVRRSIGSRRSYAIQFLTRMLRNLLTPARQPGQPPIVSGEMAVSPPPRLGSLDTPGLRRRQPCWTPRCLAAVQHRKHGDILWIVFGETTTAGQRGEVAPPVQPPFDQDGGEGPDVVGRGWLTRKYLKPLSQRDPLPKLVLGDLSLTQHLAETFSIHDHRPQGNAPKRCVAP